MQALMTYNRVHLILNACMFALGSKIFFKRKRIAVQSNRSASRCFPAALTRVGEGSAKLSHMPAQIMNLGTSVGVHSFMTAVLFNTSRGRTMHSNAHT